MQSPRAAYRAVPGALVFPPSAFDHPHRPDLRHLAADPRAVHDVDHAGDILVRLGDFFVDRRPGGGTHQDALSLELPHDVSGPRHELGLVTTEPPPRAVAARPEGFAERAVRSQQHVRVAAHVSRDQHRLAEVPEPGAELGVPRWERPRRAFAMHAQAARLSLHVVRLVLALGRRDWRAAQLPVREHDAVLVRGGDHRLEGVIAHLVAEAPRAGVDEDGDGAGREPEPISGGPVVALRDIADLDEMVAAADGAELVLAALFGALRDACRIGSGERPLALDRFQVRVAPVPLGDGPAGPRPQHGIELAGP